MLLFSAGENMRRLTINLPVALLTFLIGVMVAPLRRPALPAKPQQVEAPKASVPQAPPVAVTACDLQNEPDLYLGKLVSLEGVMYSTDSGVWIYGDCSYVKAGLPVVAVRFNWINGSLLGVFGRLDGHYYEGVHKKGKKEVDARVIGVVEYDDATDDIHHIQLDISGYKLLSPFRPFKPKGAA